MFFGLYSGNLSPVVRWTSLVTVGKRDSHSCIQVCRKYQLARAAIKVVLAVEATFWDANVPGTAVSVSCEKSARERFFGVTAKGECGSLIVPLISESYEKPTWTG